MDGVWSYVGSKDQVVWVWLAMDRATRRIVGVAFGDRATGTCQAWWASLPPSYRQRAGVYTDFGTAYHDVLPAKRHHPVAKGSGGTNHIERFNNTLRQRCRTLGRKTLSFSRNDQLYQKRIRLFINR